MSVRTTADEALDEAKEHILSAYRKILIVLDDQAWGSNEFKSEYILKLHEAAFKLLEVKRSIG